MNDKKHIAGLQFITHDVEGTTHAQLAETVCALGCRWIQLRMKHADEKTLRTEAKKVKDICAKHNAVFIVNDNVSVALQIKADGVHLGKEDMQPREARRILGNDAIIGATANTFDDVRALAHEPIDYIGLGPFRFTSTKQKLSPVIGIEGYKTIVEQCKKEGIQIPLIAVGGITLDDVENIQHAGMYGVAVSSAITGAEDVTTVVRRFVDLINPSTSLRARN